MIMVVGGLDSNNKNIINYFWKLFFLSILWVEEVIKVEIDYLENESGILVLWFVVKLCLGGILVLNVFII